MRRFKKHLAVALMAAMMVSSLSFNGAAEVIGGGDRKLNEEGEWTYWKNGEMVRDQIARFTLYKGYSPVAYFNEDGVMATDELVELDDGFAYAEPDGILISKGWAHLDEDGHKSYPFEDGNWYYFGSENEKYKRLENTTKMINKETYAFDEDGKMLSEEFLEKDGNKYYFQHEGEMAKNKWLNIGGEWYRFKSDGSCYMGSGILASASEATSSEASEYEFSEEGSLLSGNPPCSTVDSVEVKGDSDCEALIGKDLNVSFDVKLASDSNATKLTEDHDFWIEKDYSPNSYFAAETSEVDSDKNEYTIAYIAYAPSEFQVRAVIDGVKSDWVTITSDWGEDADKEKAKAVETILWGENSTEEKVDAIKMLRETLEDGSLFKRIWLDKMVDVRNLDASNAIANRNEISTDASEVESLLRTGNLELIGGSLNAERGDRIMLSATKGENVTLPETYPRQVPIELNFYKNDVETSELDIPVIVSMPIPQGVSADGLKVYHMNGADGSAELLDIKIDGNRVSFATDGFSNYVFAGNAESSNNSSSSSGGSSSGGSSSGGFKSGKKSGSSIPETPGQWNQAEKGWQFKKSDGSLYVNTWIFAKEKWYWLEPDGFMAQGWKELNGRKYYLMPVTGEMQTGWILDGQTWYYTDETGAMQTGWVSVGGKWYYLSEDGRMLSSATTPDGYRVDENGAWVQ